MRAVQARLIDRGEVVLFDGLPAGFAAGFTTAAAPRDREDEALARALGAPDAERVRAKQVHGRTVLALDDAPRHGVAIRLGEADALVTAQAGRLVMVSTADCVPVLLCDPEAGLIGAIHSGWRGTAARVTDAALDLLEERGARPERLIALLGPSISRDRYEVGPEVVAALGPAPEGALRAGKGDRSFVDVARYVVRRLRARGVSNERLFRAPLCTFDDARFPSYRREGKRAGRILNGIVRTS
jgi:hypothetical protein